jgi:hypothetical protein
MKSMEDVFGKKAPGMDMGAGAAPAGMPELPMEDEGLDLGMEEDPMGGDLESVLVSAGYSPTPEQVAQIEEILGAPGMGEDLGLDEGTGDMGDPMGGAGGMPELPPM